MFEFNQKTGVFDFNKINKNNIQTRRSYFKDLQEKLENDKI